jgi:hypothetical protein
MTAPRQVAPSQLSVSLGALARLAERLDPFDFIPRAKVAGRIITVGPFHLRQSEYAAVMDATDSTSVLLANLTPHGDVGDGPAWRVSRTYPFEALKSDGDWDGIGQSVIWDENGSWLVIVSNEGHGIVAGNERLVGEVARRLPHRNDDLVEIVDQLVAGRSETVEADGRVMAMVARLHGPEEARRVRDRLGACRERST